MAIETRENWPCSLAEEGVRPGVDLDEENPDDEQRLSWEGRLITAFCGGLLLAGFTVAAALPPDPRGFGTHQALGLPPCGFRIWYGIPCPCCGCTTCFALFVRGRWAEALTANAGGFVLALICALAVPWCVLSARRGRTWKVRSPSHVLATLATTVTLVGLLQWAVWIWPH